MSVNSAGSIPATTISKIGNLSTITYEEDTVLNNYNNDIWGLSNNIGVSLRTETEDYSVVVIKATSTTLIGRFCLVNLPVGDQFYYKFVGSRNSGKPGISFLIIRTR